MATSQYRQCAPKVELSRIDTQSIELSPCEDKRPTQPKQETQNKQTKTTQPNQKQNRTQPKNSTVGDQLVSHSHLKRIRRDDSIVSPLGLVDKMKQERTTNHENAIHQSLSHRGSPQPGASRSQSASRAGNIPETVSALRGNSDSSQVCFVHVCSTKKISAPSW